MSHVALWKETVRLWWTESEVQMCHVMESVSSTARGVCETGGPVAWRSRCRESENLWRNSTAFAFDFATMVSRRTMLIFM